MFHVVRVIWLLVMLISFVIDIKIKGVIRDLLDAGLEVANVGHAAMDRVTDYLGFIGKGVDKSSLKNVRRAWSILEMLLASKMLWALVKLAG